ncbi:hypothetical protein PC129_g13996 [Phytophthora cactorum]|uniref:CCHC-type domain-containing protein n=1 Tax=Phytophthora cactorum TaxID=29920 RepID=A0A329S2I9_9STRA|nr:hypothetical protein PC114_g16911 [Phytophthora cactorum]KAG2902955.1 hypothetical protein PC115_g15472 [Phytophthora cactorum]KAG3000702.1 hypothetical protein PC119_g16926 [Phytophthora cactorum]KAG3215125.1 hypothetical protein PC129_g13996 [Phytophthora cactorum]RAW30086.1 hypothetical protein PC110_g13555 [Phytophthora cactorum]
MVDANVVHHAAGAQTEHFMQAFERIVAGLSQQNAQIYQEFQTYLQGYQQQLQQQMQAQQAQHLQREYMIEHANLGKCIDFTNPHNGPRVVAKLAANFRDGAASWYHAKVIVEHALDQVGHFSDGLKSETKKEMIYLRCSTLAEAIAAAQAYERTHFGSERSRHSTGQQSNRGGALSREPGGPPPTYISALDQRTCPERNLCFYCKESGHRIAGCPRRNGQQRGSGQGNRVARRT